MSDATTQVLFTFDAINRVGNALRPWVSNNLPLRFGKSQLDSELRVLRKNLNLKSNRSTKSGNRSPMTKPWRTTGRGILGGWDYEPAEGSRAGRFAFSNSARSRNFSGDEVDYAFFNMGSYSAEPSNWLFAYVDYKPARQIIDEWLPLYRERVAELEAKKISLVINIPKRGGR